MNQSNIVVDFLKKVACDNGYKVVDSIFGDILLQNDDAIQQSSGAVYGIWVQSASRPNSKVEVVPDHPGWFPVYWGKDIAPVSRMKAHVQDHARTGNIALRKMKNIQCLPIIFGAILVADYQAFEKLLHDKYPPMRGSSKTGKKSTVIRIIN
jgi:hypothetical protein